MPVSLHVRPARPEDVDRLVAIHLAAFPDDRGVAARRRNFEQHRLGRLEDLRVLEADGALIAHAFLFSLEAFFGGQAVKTAGIASVGIAPEARGRGLASHLLSALEDEARARGDALSLLYPYRQGFYAKRGYANVTTSSWMEASPRAIPQDWVDRARSTPLSLLGAPGAADVEALEACYLRAARRSTGLTTRSETAWERWRLEDRRHVIVLRRGAEVTGYVAFQHEQREPHAHVIVRVDELVGDDDEARRILFGALGMQRDQVHVLRYRALDGDPFVLALEDADRTREGSEHVEHALGTVTAGPMLKLLDVRRALGARGYSRDGHATFSVAGDEGGVIALIATGGIGQTRHDRGTKNDAAPVFTPAGLASVAMGGVRARDAARLGWLTGDAAAIGRLDDLLSLSPFEVVDPF